jgi:hypothetical protein
MSTEPITDAQAGRGYRLFQIIVTLLGVAAMTAASLAVARGPSVRNSGTAVTEGLDHQYRYFAGAYFAVGVLVVITALNLRRWGRYLHVAAVVVFTGGLARLWSIVDVGASGPNQYALVALESLIVPAVAHWHRRIDHTARINQGAST